MLAPYGIVRPIGNLGGCMSPRRVYITDRSHDAGLRKALGKAAAAAVEADEASRKGRSRIAVLRAPRRRLENVKFPLDFVKPITPSRAGGL
jgi:hypothetical protein